VIAQYRIGKEKRNSRNKKTSYSILFSITDVIHEVGEIRANLLTETCQIPCVCFRCGDQNQSKNVTFKQCNASLALAVNRLDAKPTDQLTNSQGLVYELVYIIEFDPNLRTILNVYLRQGLFFF